MDNKQINDDKLNDSIPLSTIAKVLLRKIKLQEFEINGLKAQIKENKEKIKAQEEEIDKFRKYEKKIESVIEELSPEERREMKENPMYKRSLILIKELREEIKEQKNFIDTLIAQLNIKKLTYRNTIKKKYPRE